MGPLIQKYHYLITLQGIVLKYTIIFHTIAQLPTLLAKAMHAFFINFIIQSLSSEKME